MNQLQAIVVIADMAHKWQCGSDGACCELFAEFTLGTKPCPQLNNNGSCNCYSTRPKVCRVESFVSKFKQEELDRDEYLIARCHLIHKLKEWHNDCEDNKSRKWLLNKIAKSGIF